MASPNLEFWPLNCHPIRWKRDVAPLLLQVQPALIEGSLRVRVV